MKTRRPVGLTVAALLACAMLSASLFAAEGNLAEYLPRNTLLYVEMPDHGYMSLLGQFETPPLAQIISDKPIDVYALADEGLAFKPGTMRFLLSHVRGISLVADISDGGQAVAVALQTDSPETALAVLKRVAAPGQEFFTLRLPNSPPIVGTAFRHFIVLGPQEQMVKAAIGMMSARPAGQSLADDANFKKAAKAMRPGGLLWAYADGRKAIQVLDMFAGRQEQYQKVKAAIGLDGVRCAYAGIGMKDGVASVQINLAFDDKILRAAKLIPRAEQLDVLSLVPAHAFGCAALTVNEPAQYWQNLQEVVREVATALNNPQPTMGLQFADSMLGLSVKDSAFQLLSGQFAVFLSQTGTEISRNNWIGVAKVRDADKFRAAFDALQKRLMNGKTLPTEDVEGLPIMKAPNGKVFITQIKDVLVVSGSTKAILWYRNWLAKDAGEKNFKERVAGVSTLSMFVNVGTLMSIMPASVRNSGKLDSFVLFTVAHVPDELKVSLDADIGQQLKAFSPTMIATQAGILSALALPALAKARQRARRVSEMNNLRQLGVAMQAWAADHGDKQPASLAELVKGYVDQRVLLSPMDKDPQPLPDNKQIKSSFVYVGALPPKLEGQVVVAYTRPGVNPEGRNMLFRDGHVQYVRERGVKWRLRQSYNIVLEQRPDAKMLERLKKFYEID